MPERPDQRETWESYFGERRPLYLLRLIKWQLALERKHTERLFSDLHRSINIEIEFLDQRMTSKLAEVEASLNLIARELARRADGPASDKTGA